ncbi:hypothetical protein SYNPS1DRAFT_31145 [Syncephalis pseudoplumigaleata]|uniref:E3 ubiquitin-protein ligase RNF220 middle domain-containing protein n=1 Tax=Syncephalis pseudoplumigaleata TaxID=1712513 RepID=A0A4P9YUS4_9FUNG|nr:hypothetical protein SYNPS1DRAFT_31145 [Syncephalis pseudoplumigaleata]|eukprot:RKP23152.1 hypothetical protein SYNPS1DRAFT_31145 [Syncephalis pseudoplumigaleata]
MDSQTCPLCLKTVTAANYERHYRKELAALAIPQLPQVASDVGEKGAATSSSGGGGGGSSSSSRPGKRGAAIAAKSRILGETAPTKETPDQMQLLISPPESTCFMCGASLVGDLVQINAHIDRCLASPEAASSAMLVYAQQTDTAASSSQPPTDVTFEEYSWAGQTRVRVTSMLEGGASALASGAGRRIEEDTNEELDIDQDDTEQYGAQQYPCIAID